jgi:type III restriction enzyme
MSWLAPKDYQTECLDILSGYCHAVRAEMARRSSRPQREAFERITALGGGLARDYYSPPGFEQTPYVCLRLPTGAGKTLLAAYAVGRIGASLQGTDRPTCLWITPSTTIRDQTLRGLQQPTHPNRRALEESLRSQVEVMTLEEALTKPISVSSDAALVIVTTIQSYRIRDDRTGEELAATRRIYRDNGYLLTAFENIPEWARNELARDANGLVNLSLANALRLRRPIVVMDEAHNARTPISFESLARFGPSFVLELTATPEQRHDPSHPTEPRYASNVLHAVSALEVKEAGMIKLPVDMESREDWLEVLAATVQRRDELERLADQATQDSGLPFIRPIALIQAQPHSKKSETHTVEGVKAALLERFADRIQPEHVAICTGTLDEIGDTNLMETNCPIRYVITVDKLREGWDCPLAYVLGSIGNAATPTAVEQLIGRVLRMPFATPTNIPALDRAYAFVLSDDVHRTARELRDRMVETCGFDDRSAQDALRVTSTATQRGLGMSRISLSAPPPVGSLPAGVANKARYDEASRSLVVERPLERHEIEQLRECLPADADRKAVEAYWEQERPFGITPKKLGEFAKPFRIPQLTVEQDHRRALLEPEDLETYAWNLDDCDPQLSETDFSADVRVGDAVIIDLHGEALTTETAGEVRLRQLELIGEEDDWSSTELVRWLDSELHRGDSFFGLPLRESQAWLSRVVDHLTRERQVNLAVIVRRRHLLAEVLRTKVSDHGRAQARRAIQQLIRERADSVETSDELPRWIEEHAYKPSRIFEGHVFQRHPFSLVADMNEAEFDCASRIDTHANVARWLRNADHEGQGGFWLPKSPGRFFPDFIVELKSGQVVLVEYKNAKLAAYSEEQHKKAIGELWAQRSSARGRFAWVVEKDWTTLDRQLSPE